MGVPFRVGDHWLTLRSAENAFNDYGSFASPITVESRPEPGSGVVHPRPARVPRPRPRARLTIGSIAGRAGSTSASDGSRTARTRSAGKPDGRRPARRSGTSRRPRRPLRRHRKPRRSGPRSPPRRHGRGRLLPNSGRSPGSSSPGRPSRSAEPPSRSGPRSPSRSGRSRLPTPIPSALTPTGRTGGLDLSGDRLPPLDEAPDVLDVGDRPQPDAGRGRTRAKCRDPYDRARDAGLPRPVDGSRASART